MYLSPHTFASVPVLPSYHRFLHTFCPTKMNAAIQEMCQLGEQENSSNFFLAVKSKRWCENMALVGTLAWHTSTGALAIRWTPPPSLCWWNASKGICRSSAWNHHSRTLRSFNPSVFPGGGAMAVRSLPTPSDAPLIV